MGGRRHPAAEALAAYTVLAVALLWGGWRSPLTRNAGAAGDMPIFAWSLRWVPWALTHLHNPFFTTHLHSPDGANLMWNTTVLLPGLLLSPLTLLGGPLLTFNVLATLGLVAPAWAAYAALRRLPAGACASWLGGLAWGLGPWMLAQTRGDHLHLTLGSAALPLLAIAAHEVFVLQRRSPMTLGLAVGASAGLWVLVGEEALAIAALSVAIGVLAAIACGRDWWVEDGPARLRYASGVLGVALAAFVVVAAVPIGWQLLGPQRIHGAIFSADAYSADLLAAVTPSKFQLLTAPASGDLHHRFGSEDGAYLSAPVLMAAAVVAVRERRRRVVQVLVVTAGALWLLSLGPHLRVAARPTDIPLPFGLLRRLPMLENLLPVRLTASVGLAVAALLAIGADTFLSSLGSRPRPRYQMALFASALVACAAALAPGLPFRSNRSTIPAFFTQGAVRHIPEGSLAVLAPSPRPERPLGQLWQAAAGMRFRMEGGYMLAPDGRGHAGFAQPMSPTALAITSLESGHPGQGNAMVASVRADLEDRKVSTVIVGPMAHGDQVVGLFSQVLGRDPLRTGGVCVWEGVPELLSATPGSIVR